MELNTIVEALRATTVVGSQKDAVAYLDEVCSMVQHCFYPLILDLKDDWISSFAHSNSNERRTRSACSSSCNYFL